jgi:hypothetical protein
MPSIGAALLNSLRSVERPGDFCVGGLREIFMPTIDVDGAGRIAFPLLPVQVERLVAIAEAAPYGWGEETVIDRGVRRTWQIDPGKVRVGGRHWEETLAELVAHVSLGLGVSEPVAADFYKLLVYDAGSFFIGHRDTEKVPGMFATMVLVLPSTHSGGELIITHLDREVVLDPRPEEPSEIGFAAFYADCVHEVRPVIAGCRLTLVYNLRFLGKKQPPKPPDYRTEQRRTEELLRLWADAMDEPDKLILPLEHAYTPAELSFETLKGRDAAVAAVLVEAAADANCDLHLALVSIEESGSAEYTGYYGHRRRQRRDEEDEDEFEVGEVFDRALILSQPRRPDGREAGFGDIPFTEAELCPPDAFEDLTPDRAAIPRGDRQRGGLVRAHLSARRSGAVAACPAARRAESGRARGNTAASWRPDDTLGGGRRWDRVATVERGRRAFEVHAALLAPLVMADGR